MVVDKKTVFYGLMFVFSGLTGRGFVGLHHRLHQGVP